jgi:hypothetical protein
VKIYGGIRRGRRKTNLKKVLNFIDENSKKKAAIIPSKVAIIEEDIPIIRVLKKSFKVLSFINEVILIQLKLGRKIENKR